MLKGFKNKHKFNIIFFSSDVNHCKLSMVNATPSFRQDALDFINRTQPGGTTNIYDALQFAFKDPEVQAIYFLTDGIPTAGQETNIREILRSVRNEWNEDERVEINTTALLTGGDFSSEERQARRFMRRMARQNDGIFRIIK